MNEKSSGWAWLLGIALCVAVCFGLSKVIPWLGTALLIAGGIFLALVIALIVLVIVFSREKPEPKNALPDSEPKKVLSRGRANLMELRRMTLQVKDPQVRQLGSGICGSVDKILHTLNAQPEDIPNVRQFLNYYLPTLRSILTKYVKLEASGVPAEEMTRSAVSCLQDIDVAMQRQYQSLFDNDRLDLSVEMEALTLACKRDGLLTDEEFKAQVQDKILL